MLCDNITMLSYKLLVLSIYIYEDLSQFTVKNDFDMQKLCIP